MVTLTIELGDDIHERLRKLAEARGIAVQTLVAEMAAESAADAEAFGRFRALADKGEPDRGLDILKRVDRAFARRR